MTDDERDLEVLKLITSAEQHFNNLTFKVRALASTWLLATFAGVGWILKDLPVSSAQSEVVLSKVGLLIALCIGSSIGILVLWVLDIRVYQQMTNIWFDTRKKYESNDHFPPIRIGMKSLFKTGRATELIILFYLALAVAPLLLAMFIAWSSSRYLTFFLLLALLFLIVWGICRFSPKDEQWIKEKEKSQSK